MNRILQTFRAELLKMELQNLESEAGQTDWIMPARVHSADFRGPTAAASAPGSAPMFYDT